MARKIKLEISIEGNPVGTLEQLVINQGINQHHHFEVSCMINEKDNSLIEAGQKNIGKELKIEVKSDWFGNTANFFKGLVTDVGLSRFQGSRSQIVFSGYSPTILMDEGPWAVSFTEQDLKGVVNKITGNYGNLDISVDPAGTDKIPYLVQYKESNFQFLNRISHMYGEWFYYDGSKLRFGKLKKEKAVELKLGRDLHHFDLSMRLSPTEFKLQAYDYLNNRVYDGPSSDASITDLDQYGDVAFKKSQSFFNQQPLIPFDQAIASKSDLGNFALLKRTSQSNDLVMMNGASDNPNLKVGGTIKVLGMINEGQSPREVNYGEFTVVSVNHASDGLGNYQNHFRAVPASLKRPPRLVSISQPICETQVATVKENHDPEEMGRIKVQFNWQEGSEMTPWTRFAAAAGGSGQGFYFVPEVGDEVIVSFEHNNPSRPYVVGCVYHGKSKPSGTSDPDNNKKQILTKSGNTISLNDEGGKEEISIVNGTNTITLSLSGPGKVSISTAGNLELTGKNVSISAEQELTVSAGTKADVSAGTEMAISAGAKAELSSMTVTINGDAKTTVSSSAQLELSGGAMASVQAPMVKLN